MNLNSTITNKKILTKKVFTTFIYPKLKAHNFFLMFLLN